MKRTVVRYKAKPEAVAENQRLIENVFKELHAKAPAGVGYLAMKLDDGTFVHFVMTEEGAPPIPGLDAFKLFQSGIKERCDEPPKQSEVTIVGEYRMLRG
jgi:hypothetical protein